MPGCCTTYHDVRNIAKDLLLHGCCTTYLSMKSFILATVCTAITASVPGVLLGNTRGTAQPGLMMPYIGLGTGAYSDNAAVGNGGYPECWSTTHGCGAWAALATTTWLSVGGRRLDAANSYDSQIDVGRGMAASGVPREDIFLLSKVGPSQPLGFNDTLSQFATILSDMNQTYVDTLLIHWPWNSASKGNVTNNATQSTDPLCNTTVGNPYYSEKGCRLSTWRAMIQIYNAGGAKSIGVSNFNISHFEEIKEAGLPLPAITQSPFHLYLSGTQLDLLSFCWRNGIVFLGYSPLGVPDYKVYPPSLPSPSQLTDPVVVDIAARYSITPAQVLLLWQYQLGIPVNPRSMNKQ